MGSGFEVELRMVSRIANSKALETRSMQSGGYLGDGRWLFLWLVEAGILQGIQMYVWQRFFLHHSVQIQPF